MARILYFTTDFSDKNQAFAKEYGLLIRNAGAYGVIDFVERCDMVFGEIPKAYEHLPKFELQKSKQEPKRKTKAKQTQADTKDELQVDEPEVK